MNLAQKIQNLRKKNNLSQEQLADNIILPNNGNSSMKKNRIYMLIGFLIVSLLGNALLWSERSDYHKRTDYVKGENYTAFFDTLNIYNNSLVHIVANEGNQYEIEREVIRLQEDVNNLINYARGYVALNPKREELSGMIWDIATSSRWLLREYSLQADEKEIKDNVEKINVAKIIEFSKIIDEIIVLENNAREKMISSSKGFRASEMSDVLHPKVMRAAELTILSK